MEIDRFNHLLQKASQDRFDFRISKNGVSYLYDYDDQEQAIVRSKVEIKDIIDNQFLENFCYDKAEIKELENFRKENKI